MTQYSLQVPPPHQTDINLWSNTIQFPFKLTQMLAKCVKSKLIVWTYLNRNLPGIWIRRASDNNNVLLKWPPRSPDLIPRDFFSMGLCERTGLYPHSSYRSGGA